MGSSLERVRIADIGDVVYYRQVKDYSDQDYESSRDLQKAIQRGALTIMEHSATPKSMSNPSNTYTTVNNASVVDMEAIKQAVREAMPENKSKSISDSLRDLIPSIVDMVRQEISSAFMSMRPAVSQDTPTTVISSDFVGPEYVPTVTTEGMVSNINVEAKASSGNDVASNLDLLRKLRQQQSK